MAAHLTIDLTGGIPEARRFVVTDEERAYYEIICGLAYSQWSWYAPLFSICFFNFCSSFMFYELNDFFCPSLKAVEFSKTSVTYCSLGQSVEPRGKVDIFFVAGMCCKFFEDQHPRQSKKHFFYPKVGVSL